jgi:hypothetical protein
MATCVMAETWIIASEDPVSTTSPKKAKGLTDARAITSWLAWSNGRFFRCILAAGCVQYPGHHGSERHPCGADGQLSPAHYRTGGPPGTTRLRGIDGTVTSNPAARRAQGQNHQRHTRDPAADPRAPPDAVARLSPAKPGEAGDQHCDSQQYPYRRCQHAHRDDHPGLPIPLREPEHTVGAHVAARLRGHDKGVSSPASSYRHP